MYHDRQLLPFCLKKIYLKSLRQFYLIKLSIQSKMQPKGHEKWDSLKNVRQFRVQRTKSGNKFSPLQFVILQISNEIRFQVCGATIYLRF